MRVMTLIVFSFAVAGSAYALATSQSAAQERVADASSRETPDEVIVRGQRLAELRFEVQEAREHAYAIFNEINSSDDFDVHCRDERKYHSRAKKRVCRARFESRISSEAVKEYLAQMTMTCPGEAGGVINWQACMFSGYGQRAAAATRAIEGQAPPLHERMNDEIQELARTDLRFGQAILDFYEASQQYNEARGRSEEEE
jgi:hypothetical protein